MTALTHEIRDFTVKETATEVRKALRAAFPGTKFSVRMDRGTAYGWMRCDWTDGPTVDQVTPLLARFESERWSGTDELYHHVEPTLYAREDGTLYEPHYNCCGINWQRTYSPDAEAWAEQIAVRGTRWWPIGADFETWAVNPGYYAGLALLRESDLTGGLPAEAE